MCSACGTFFCGECKPQLARRACAADADRELRERGWGACPACRAPLRASHSENVKRLERLLVARTEGKHVARVQYKLGLAYELGRGAGRDDAKASSLYEAAARGGHVKAMFAYAISLDEGRGLQRDAARAVEWFQHAAAKGSAKAQFSLGIRFAEGRGVARDPGRALHWFEKAASQNHAKARCNLGIMFASGIGVARDDSKAARYYLAAATGGVPRAMFDLAVLYARGRGVLKDDVAAVAWCERAAVAGDAAACVNMAHVLGQGLVGRCPDSRAARRWLDLATRRRGSRRDDARDTAVSSLVAAAPAPQLRSLVPGPAPTSPKDSVARFLPALPV